MSGGERRPGRSGWERGRVGGQTPCSPLRSSASLRGPELRCRAQGACLTSPRCPPAGGGWSHFIISPKPKEASAPQSPAGCS